MSMNTNIWLLWNMVQICTSIEYKSAIFGTETCTQLMFGVVALLLKYIS